MLALLHGSGIALSKKTSIAESDLEQALSEITGKSAFQGVSGQIVFGPDSNPIDKVVTVVCNRDGYFVLDTVQRQFLVGGSAQTRFPASSACS